jgi:hypothetical protein
MLENPEKVFEASVPDKSFSNILCGSMLEKLA